MKKPKLDVTAMTEEMGAVASFAHPRASEALPAAPLPPTPEREPQPAKQSGDQSANRLNTRSTTQSTDQSTKQPSRPSTEHGGMETVDRPKAFYITTRLDRRLNEAVRYYQEMHGLKKVDRSAIVNAMLDIDERWSDEALDNLVKRIMDQLTSRLVD